MPSPASLPTPSQCDPLRLLRDGFHELLGAAPGDETAVLAFALALAARVPAAAEKGICFCCTGGAAQEYGRIYGHGLAALGAVPERMLVVTAPGEKDLLWTLEEAVTSGAFGAVVGMLPAGERLYGFTASRRLKLRRDACLIATDKESRRDACLIAASKEPHRDAKATPLFLIRHWQGSGATAAHGRWRVGALPSLPEEGRGSVPLLGPPRLRLGLERMGGLPPQQWDLGRIFACPTASLFEDESDVTRGFHLAALLENGPARKAAGGRQRAA